MVRPDCVSTKCDYIVRFDNLLLDFKIVSDEHKNGSKLFNWCEELLSTEVCEDLKRSGVR